MTPSFGCGRRVLVISTKARDIGAGQEDTPERARSWLDGDDRAGMSGRSTALYALFKAATPGEIELTSERGVRFRGIPTSVDDYMGLVVVNYAAPAGYVPVISATTPTIAIQAREWEFILSEVRTTTGLFSYPRTTAHRSISISRSEPRGKSLALLGMAEYGEELLLVGDGCAAVPPMAPLRSSAAGIRSPSLALTRMTGSGLSSTP